MPATVDIDPAFLRLVNELRGLGTDERSGFIEHLSETEPDEVLLGIFKAADAEFGAPLGIWQDDPVGFIHDVCHETISDLQKEICYAVRDEPFVAVPSAFSTGKTYIEARLQAWWVSVYPPGTAKCITTASRLRQVDTQLWLETRRLQPRANLPGKVLTRHWYMPTSDGRVELVSWGFTPPPHEPEAVQGTHAAHVLILADEAGLINPITGQAWLSASTGAHTRFAAFGNPPVDQEDSWLEKVSTSPDWKAIFVPADSTPNFTGEDVGRCRSCIDWKIREHPVTEHLISPDDVAMFAREYGEDSAFYQAKVECKFVKGAANKVVPGAWVATAKIDRSLYEDGLLDPATLALLRGPDPLIALGCDTAQGGSDEMVTARAEGRLTRIVRTQRGEANRNSFDVAGYIKEDIADAQKLRRELYVKHPLLVLVDITGDRGPVDTLNAWNSEGLLGPDVKIVGVNFGEGAERPHDFINRRAEMWWGVRELCQPDPRTKETPIHLDIDDKTAGQISDPRHQTSPNGRKQVEGKKDLRSRGRPSPDRGDAIALCRYRPESLIPKKKRGIITGA